MLGYLLAGGDYAARRRMAARRYAGGKSTTWPSGYCVAQLVAPDECSAIDSLREQRAKARVVDPLAKRRPGYAEATIAQRRAESAIAAARFREATHQHRTRVHLCDRGSERASSATDKARPADVGLGKSYSDVGFWVTTSTHDWYVSPAILAAEVRTLNAEAPNGVVYLRADLRVVQGRGTALKVERRGPKGGWS